MNTQTFFHKFISLLLITSFGISPLSVFAQEVAEVSLPSSAAVETVPVTSVPTVETPAIETSPSISPDSETSVEEIAAVETPTSEEPASEESPAEDVEEKSEEESSEEEKEDDPEEPNELLDSTVYPFEDERQPVNTNVRLSADESSGALTLSYPINSPPGRNGIEPGLSLSYNSRSHEDVNVAGFGWSVDIPYIERINRKGSETLYSDFYFSSSFDDELASSSATNTE